MMRHYEGADETLPSAAELFVASVIACFTAFVISLILLAIAPFINGTPDPVATAMSVILIGGMWGMMIAAFLTFIIIAPLATLIGIILVRAVPPSIWLGSVVGLLSAVLLIAAIMAPYPNGLPNFRDMPMLATFSAIAAFSGWVGQTYILHWPDLRNDEDYL